jgi:hypothetical protein
MIYFPWIHGVRSAGRSAQKRLSKEARLALEREEDAPAGGGLLVSAISCWVVAMLTQRGRLALNREVEQRNVDIPRLHSGEHGEGVGRVARHPGRGKRWSPRDRRQRPTSSKSPGSITCAISRSGWRRACSGGLHQIRGAGSCPREHHPPAGLGKAISLPLAPIATSRFASSRSGNAPCPPSSEVPLPQPAVDRHHPDRPPNR